MGRNEFLKKTGLITIVAIFSIFLFHYLDKRYVHDVSQPHITNLYLINNKDTIILHDTIVNVRWRKKNVKVCCCRHDTITCKGEK